MKGKSALFDNLEHNIALVLLYANSRKTRRKPGEGLEADLLMKGELVADEREGRQFC